uniref:Uncharacterized protein n=1 Tax=Ixodes scapularis TaxID=6945 RepID=A0A4D5RGZ9_IXOSC
MAVDKFSFGCFDCGIRLPLLLLLLFLQNKNVRLVSNRVLFWLHGPLQLHSGSLMWYVWVHRYKCVCPEDLLYRQDRLKKKKKVEKLYCFLVQELQCTKVRRVPSSFFMSPPVFRRGRTSVASCIARFWIPCLCVLLGGFFFNLFVIEEKEAQACFSC